MKHIISFLLILSLLLTGCVLVVTPPETIPNKPPETQGTTATTPPPTVTEPTVTEPSVTEPSVTEPSVTEPVTEPTETEPPTTEPAVVLSLPESILLNMTLEEKVGQLFLARCPGADAAQDAADYYLGGYVLFWPDFYEKTHDEVTAAIQSYQDAARIPMLIAVDEEGGIVCRVSCEPQFRETRFSSPRRLYEAGGQELILSTEAEKIQLLSSLGINVNLAPVCDVTTDPEAFMYSRSLGLSPEETGAVISAMVQVSNRYRFGAVLKHFPGYGNNTDTHIGIAIDNRSLSTLEEADLVPFQAGIDAGASAIMISHTFVNCLDTEMPASLSPVVIGYLRNNMGFDGVIVTDDLAMEAITDLYGAGESAVLAVLAGNDLLCSTEYRIQYQAVLEAVQNGRISQEKLDTAVLRILNWKSHLGLLDKLV